MDKVNKEIQSIIHKFGNDCFNHSQEYIWQHFKENIFAYTQEECLEKFKMFLYNILLSKTSVSKICWRMLPKLSKERLYQTADEKTDKYIFYLSFRFSIESFNKRYKKQVMIPKGGGLFGELPMPPKEYFEKRKK